MKEILRELLIKHEGLRLKPYVDTVGKLTIGVGRNLDDVGISKDEALFMLDNDIEKCEAELKQFDWFNNLDEVRQIVLLDMAFNLGIPRLLKFKKTIQYIQDCDFENAAKEMLDSTWAKQVKGRALELSEMMRTGRIK
jgi:lysozyme